MRQWKEGWIGAFYELSYEDHSLIVRVHRTLVAGISKKFDHKAPIVEDYMREFGFKVFTPPREGDWGFEDVAKFSSVNDHWITWKFPLPVFKAKGDEMFSTRANNSAAIRTTLNVLFLVLEIARDDDWETGCGEPQLIAVLGLRIEKDARTYGGALHAVITPAMCKWLSTLGKEERYLQPVMEAMREASDYMWYPHFRTSDKMLVIDYPVIFRPPKWIHLNVPGNACGLDPDSHYPDSLDEGYQLSPHNTDSGLQQLALLVGLAKLHDMARPR